MTDFEAIVGAELKSYLCVGGPHAGKRYMAPKDQDWFRVAIAPQLSAQDFDPNKEDKAITIQTVDYRRESIHTPDGRVSFWVPHDQSPLTTMKMLLGAYEEYCKDSRP
jgi:hypothetical protein